MQTRRLRTRYHSNIRRYVEVSLYAIIICDGHNAVSFMSRIRLYVPIFCSGKRVASSFAGINAQLYSHG